MIRPQQLPETTAPSNSDSRRRRSPTNRGRGELWGEADEDEIRRCRRSPTIHGRGESRRSPMEMKSGGGPSNRNDSLSNQSGSLCGDSTEKQEGRGEHSAGRLKKVCDEKPESIGRRRRSANKRIVEERKS
jgi:hypothetical protein